MIVCLTAAVSELNRISGLGASVVPSNQAGVDPCRSPPPFAPLTPSGATGSGVSCWAEAANSATRPTNASMRERRAGGSAGSFRHCRSQYELQTLSYL